MAYSCFYPKRGRRLFCALDGLNKLLRFPEVLVGSAVYEAMGMAGLVREILLDSRMSLMREVLRELLSCGDGERAGPGGTFLEQRDGEDGGSPALWSSAVLWLRVLDVNDSAPAFAEARYSAHLPENNAADALVRRVRAWDVDWGQNARVRYRLGEGRVRGAPLSSSVSVAAETDALYALRSFDYEEVREVGPWMRAGAGGAPALSSNVSVRLVIVDENDNAPQLPSQAEDEAVTAGVQGDLLTTYLITSLRYVSFWAFPPLRPRQFFSQALLCSSPARVSQQFRNRQCG
ncbi:hypothetical protein Q9233_009213 [Columba guinea]|nr:hypothetical protein Q9233_009213 [Columba guinea]